MKKNLPSSSKLNSSDNVWKRMFTPNSSWEDKDQFLDVIYWSRQVLAIFMGMIWGFIGITGFFGIASFVALNSIAVYLYSVRFNNDTEDIMEFVKEGFMTSFAGFLHYRYDELEKGKKILKRIHSFISKSSMNCFSKTP